MELRIGILRVRDVLPQHELRNILVVVFRKHIPIKTSHFYTYRLLCVFRLHRWCNMSVASDNDSSSSSSSSSSSHGHNSTSSHDAKWETLYALRERIVRFVGQLEKRTKLYSPPFHRYMIGGDAKIEQVSVRYSEDVSQSAGEYIVGVFNDGETIDPHSSTYVCNYPGWILTQQEYTELNDDAHENMGALFGIDVPLQAFVRKHWNPTWDPAWKEVEWVVLGDPVSTGGNFNTLSGIPNKAYNCEFRINNRAEYKVLTKDGRYSVISEVVTIHRQKAATIRTGVELFVAYDNLIRAKKRLAAE